MSSHESSFDRPAHGGYPTPSERLARPGETCDCGRPAAVVYITERFGEVAYCGIPDGGERARAEVE